MKIGVIGDSFRVPLFESIEQAARLGADGISFYAAAPEFAAVDPVELRRHCKDAGLEIASLIAEPGGHGWERPDENRWKIPRIRQIIDSAAELNIHIITGHIGVLPENPGHPRYAVMRAACVEIGNYAADRDVCFGIETGPEPVTRLRAFLDELDAPGIGVNLDPANLVMVVRDDPVQAVHTLAPYLISTHAKDGRNLQSCDPEEVYDAFADGGFEELIARTGTLFEELPLGKGDVPWDAWLAALRECGFNGWLTIEREAGDNRLADIAEAIYFLHRTAGVVDGKGRQYEFTCQAQADYGIGKKTDR